MKKCLGILGGIGASAGLRFAQYAIEEAQRAGAKCDADYPPFLLYNLPSVGLDAQGELCMPVDAIEQTQDGLKKLAGAGCEVGVIACNTLHRHHADLARRFPGQLLNMVEIACSEVPQGVEKVGVLSSRCTRDSGLYAKALLANHLQSVITNDREQEFLDAAIQAVISGRQNHGHRSRVQQVIVGLRRRGAEAIIVGCTELPLVIRWLADTRRLIDAGRVTVEHALTLL